jgi:hypothetical protein
MTPSSKSVVRLSVDQRQALGRLIHTGTHPAHTLTRAGILLQAAADGPDAWPDERIAGALEVCRMTVMGARQQFLAEGLDAAPHKKKPTGRQDRRLDGGQEARLVALACSAPPEGRGRWTRRLLADKLVELEVVESIAPSTICRTLQKTTSSPGSSSSGSWRRRGAGRSSPRWRT